MSRGGAGRRSERGIRCLQPAVELGGKCGKFMKPRNLKRCQIGFGKLLELLSVLSYIPAPLRLPCAHPRAPRSSHRSTQVCLPRIQLPGKPPNSPSSPLPQTSRFTCSSHTLPLVSQTAPRWSPCSARIWTQPLLLCGPEAQAGPFVLQDKSKKGGHGRRISLSPAQTTHLLVVVISCLSLLRFLLLSFLLSSVRAEDIGPGCTVNSQSRDTSLHPFPFFCPPATVGHNCPDVSLFVSLRTKAAAWKGNAELVMIPSLINRSPFTSVSSSRCGCKRGLFFGALRVNGRKARVMVTGPRQLTQ